MSKPRLYEAGTLEFSSNGLGILTDATACRVRRAFGEAELEMSYPATGRLFGALTYRRIILAQGAPQEDPQPYYIYRIAAGSGGNAKVYARHVAYQLDGVPVRPYSATTAAEAFEKLEQNTMVAHPFRFETNVERNGSFAFTVPTAAWSLLGGQEGSLLDTYHGEYDFDGYTVRLLTRRGKDRGVSIRYGKNLQTLEQDASCAGCYTGVVPYWTDAQTGETVSSEPVPAEGEYGYTRVLPVDFTDKFEAKPTANELSARARQYIRDNDIGVPTVSLTVKFAALEQTEELKTLALLERVDMGDTVHVYFPKLGVDATARVVETDYDCLAGRYESVTIGKVKQTIAEMVVAQQEQLEKIPTATSLSLAMAQATAAVTGARGGAVRLLDTDGDGLPDTIYIADKADPADAKHVWRFNWAGWGYSSDGYDGEFTMAATIAGGIIADMITTGNLNASLITTGELNASLIKTGVLNADLIRAGKLAAQYIDIDSLTVKNLRAEEKDENGFTGIVETDTGTIRVKGNDGSLTRTLATLNAKALESNLASCYALLRMHSYTEGVLTTLAEFSPLCLKIMSSTEAFADRYGVFSVEADDETGKVWVSLDNLNATGRGNCKWEYNAALGKTILVNTEEDSAT